MSKLGQQSHYRPRRTQSITTSGTSAKTTNAVGEGINVVRLVAYTNPAFIKFGETGDEATASDMYLPVNLPEYFSIRAGQFVHAIQSGAAGTVNVTEMTQ